MRPATAVASSCLCLAVGATVRAQSADDEAPVAEESTEEVETPIEPRAEEDGAVGEAAAEVAVEPEPEVEPSAEAPLPDAPDARARALYERGQRFYEEGRYPEAVADFREAYELSGRPLLQFNIANALERDGAYRSAADALRRYRQHADESEREVLDQRIASLERRIAIRDHEPPPPPPPPPPELVPAWVMFSVAGAFAIAGSGFGIAALSARDDVDQSCTVTAGRRICTAAAGGALDRDSAFSVLTDVSFGFALASAVGAVVWILLELDRDAPAAVDVAGSSVQVDVAF